MKGRASVADTLRDLKYLHAVGAAAVAVEITLGQDDPVAFFKQRLLFEQFDGFFADLRGLDLGGIEGNRIYPAKHGGAPLGGRVAGIAINRHARAYARHDERRSEELRGRKKCVSTG